VNSQQAKQILMLFRPGTADEQDASFDEARRQAKTDPQLALWFDEHCAGYLALRRKFHEIPIPPGLKEQILSERKTARPFFQRYWGPLLAAAAVVVLLLSLEAGSWRPGGPSSNHEAYIKRMGEAALRSYYMDFETNDPNQIRFFLAGKHAPSNYMLPPGLKLAEATGCLVTVWQNSPVSMVCFKTGRPLEPGEKSDLWLFVADRAAVANAPAPGAPPVFERVNKATVASWSDAGKTYLLAAVADETFLSKYLH
jgi:hypothetical protein